MVADGKAVRWSRHAHPIFLSLLRHRSKGVWPSYLTVAATNEAEFFCLMLQGSAEAPLCASRRVVRVFESPLSRFPVPVDVLMKQSSEPRTGPGLTFSGRYGAHVLNIEKETRRVLRQSVYWYIRCTRAARRTTWLHSEASIGACPGVVVCETLLAGNLTVFLISTPLTSPSSTETGE